MIYMKPMIRKRNQRVASGVTRDLQWNRKWPAMWLWVGHRVFQETTVTVRCARDNSFYIYEEEMDSTSRFEKNFLISSIALGRVRNRNFQFLGPQKNRTTGLRSQNGSKDTHTLGHISVESEESELSCKPWFGGWKSVAHSYLISLTKVVGYN